MKATSQILFSGIMIVVCWAALAHAQDTPFLDSSPFNTFIEEHITPGNDPARGNYVYLVDRGYEALLLRVHLMRTARKSIDIQTYIWADDECARIFRHELRKAADRGVKVRVLADPIISHKDPRRLAAHAIASPNVEIKIYRPLADRVKASLPLTTLELLDPDIINQRMHIKTFIVDGIAGITGGRNTSNNYFNYSLGYNFKDLDVLIVGPAVAAMTDSFNAFWQAPESINSLDLVDVADEATEVAPTLRLAEALIYPGDYFRTLTAEADDPAVIADSFLAQLHPAHRVTYIADMPGRKQDSAKRFGSGAAAEALLDLFKNAENEIVIQSPYMIIDGRLSDFIKECYAAHPDLRIRISTNSYGAADHLIAYAANYRLRSKVVLGLGVEVFELKPHPEALSYYAPTFPDLEARAKATGESRPYLSIHSKAYVFDDDTAFVGTFNLDPRSFHLNSEGGTIIEDTVIAGALKKRLLEDMAPENSWPIAKKKRLLYTVNRGIEKLSMQLPFDVWPLRSTSGFELLPGHTPVSSESPAFYQHYKDIGPFPGADGPSAARAITRAMKVFGKPVTPLL